MYVRVSVHVLAQYRYISAVVYKSGNPLHFIDIAKEKRKLKSELIISEKKN